MTAALDVQLLGISHLSAPIALLERLALSSGEVDQLYDALLERGCEDALVLSTCNRTEIYATGGEGGALLAALTWVVGAERLPELEHFYQRSGLDTLRHLHRVACGLDSMVLGEAQILGQAHAAHERSLAHHRPTPAFERAVQSALRTGARSREETDIGRGAVSVASAAVQLAGRIHSDLTDKVVAVVGAGETGRLVAEHLSRRQPAQLWVLNRTLGRAEQVARAVSGLAAGMEALPQLLAQASVLALAVRLEAPLLGAAEVERARGVAKEPMVVLDLGLPRLVRPEVNQLPNVFAYDLEALRHIMDTNLARRRHAMAQVEAIIDEELERFAAWRRSLEAGPLIAALRESADAWRRQEIERYGRDLSPKERERVEQVTRAVMNKLLHGPMTSIREFVATADRHRLEVVRGVFGHLQARRDDDDTRTDN